MATPSAMNTADGKESASMRFSQWVKDLTSPFNQSGVDLRPSNAGEPDHIALGDIA